MQASTSLRWRVRQLVGFRPFLPNRPANASFPRSLRLLRMPGGLLPPTVKADPLSGCDGRTSIFLRYALLRCVQTEPPRPPPALTATPAFFRPARAGRLGDRRVGRWRETVSTTARRQERSRDERKDIYARVTGQIVAAIEAGLARGDVRLPWHQGGQATTRPRNVASGKIYRGANIVALWAAAELAGYPTGLWGTYRQWAELGAQVRKGERATSIVFWKVGDRQEAGEEDGQEAGEEDGQGERGESEEGGCSRRFFARGYAVFNASQVDGLNPPAVSMLSEAERIAHAERFCVHLGIEVRHGGDRACYVPSQDLVQMPPFAAFRDAEGYYAVLLHECGHGSGAQHRLDRDLSGRFGSAAYAMEEIVVELASAMVCAALGLSLEPRSDHARYIASWLAVLRSDSHAIFAAAAKAQAIADWMEARQPAPIAATDDAARAG